MEVEDKELGVCIQGGKYGVPTANRLEEQVMKYY